MTTPGDEKPAGSGGHWTDGMPLGAKVGILSVVVVGGLVLVAIVGVIVWRGSSQDPLVPNTRRIGIEGASFGRASTTSDCRREVFRRNDGKHGLALSADQLMVFLVTCLEAAPKSPGFCERTPRVDDPVATEAFPATSCAELGRPRDSFCLGVQRQVAKFCDRRE